MHVPAPVHSRIRRLIGISVIACFSVALIGRLVADFLDDTTPPYHDVGVATIAWNMFLGFGAATLILGVTYVAMHIWQETRGDSV
jgi:hypothetical protein